MNKKHTPKFTLIEVLVVVAIIGILASLLLPSLAKARHKAKTSVCLSNLKQITTAIHLYAGDNEDHLPGHFNNKTYDMLLGTGYDGRSLDSDGKLYSCPTDTTDDGTNNNRSYSAVQGELDGSKPGKRGAIDEGSGETLRINEFNYPSTSIIISERHYSGNTIKKWNTAMMKMQTIQNGTVNGNYSWSHEEYKFNHIFADSSVRAISHVATYAGSGSDPWNDESMIGTMWDSLR